MQTKWGIGVGLQLKGAINHPKWTARAKKSLISFSKSADLNFRAQPIGQFRIPLTVALIQTKFGATHFATFIFIYKLFIFGLWIKGFCDQESHKIVRSLWEVRNLDSHITSDYSCLDLGNECFDLKMFLYWLVHRLGCPENKRLHSATTLVFLFIQPKLLKHLKIDPWII